VPFTLAIAVSPSTCTGVVEITYPYSQYSFSAPVATSLGSATLSSGKATVTVSKSLDAGTYTLSADYKGDANCGAVTASLSQTVAKASTSMTLTSDPNPSIYGDIAKFTACGLPLDTTGTVTLIIPPYAPAGGATTLNMSRQPQSTCASTSTNFFVVGANPVSARFSGDTNYQSSTSNTITQTVKAH
jgi:hypothetical protein